MKTRLVDLRQSISRQRAAEASTPEGVRRLEAAERQWRDARGNETFETARAKRERAVDNLIKEARRLTADGQLAAARGIVARILVLDPQNDYGIGVLPMLNDGGLSEQRHFYERFETEPLDTGRLIQGGHLASARDWWFVIPLAVVLPSVWRRLRARSRSRSSRGLCSVCGYDLRATPCRCPECGNVPIATAVLGSTDAGRA
jgi:hypothetical protein